MGYADGDSGGRRLASHARSIAIDIRITVSNDQSSAVQSAASAATGNADALQTFSTSLTQQMRTDFAANPAAGEVPTMENMAVTQVPETLAAAADDQVSLSRAPGCALAFLVGLACF